MTKDKSNTPTDQATPQKSAPRRGNCLGRLALHIGLMIIVAVALAYGTLWWLKGYTRHYDSVRVPDVRGISIVEAQQRLRAVELEIEVVDSVYNETMAPGAIIETTPEPNAMVKKDRTIYVVVNNTQVKQATVPDVTDKSRRQAEAMMRSAGFADIRIEYIAGEHNDLSLHIKDSHGRIVSPGEKLPFNAPATLVVYSKAMATDTEAYPDDYSTDIEILTTEDPETSGIE